MFIVKDGKGGKGKQKQQLLGKAYARRHAIAPQLIFRLRIPIHPSILPAGVLSFASTLSFCMPEIGKCQNPECKLGPNMIEPMLSPKTSTLISSCRRSVIAKVPVPPTSGQLLQLGRSDCAEFNLLRRDTKDALWLRSPAQAATACDGLLQDFDCEG